LFFFLFLFFGLKALALFSRDYLAWFGESQLKLIIEWTYTNNALFLFGENNALVLVGVVNP
jgi:hypothetical protein